MGIRDRVIGGVIVRAVAAAALMTLMACGIDAEKTNVVVDETSADCGLWGCASNAATMAHELDGSGQEPNDVGLKFVSFADVHGRALRIEVVADELVGLLLVDSTMTLKGADLLGAIMTVKDKSGAPYYIRLDEVSSTRFWPEPAFETTGTYVFMLKSADPKDQEWRNLCSDPRPKGPRPPLWTHDLDWAWAGRPIAVVFSGDRYDNGSLTVSTSNVGKWFNIACAGSAVAKMHLLRYTTASHDATVTSDVQRTAVLKMITDDICGTGHSFTVDGEDVFYLDWLGHHSYAYFDGRTRRSVEGIWTEDGAYCILEPRRQVEDPATLGAIYDECERRRPDHKPPPSCKDADTSYWQTYGQQPPAPSQPRIGWGFSMNP